MKAFFLFMASLVFIAAGCQKPAVESDRLSLLATDKKWAAALTEGEIEHIVSFWDDDGMIYFPGEPAAFGKNAILAMVKKNRETPGFALTTSPADAVVAASGEFGYTLGTFNLSVLNSEGKSVSRNGNYVNVWQKQADGAWKCAIEIANFRPSAD